MQLTAKEIIKKINEEFPKTYKAQGSLINSGDLYDKSIDTVKDLKLLNHIIFCNDVLKIPPVKVFLLSQENDFSNLTDFDKTCLGAFWGFVFKFVLGYDNQKSTSILTKGIRTATYFYDKKIEVELVNE